MRRSAYRGCLLGLAVGDAMGYTVDSRSWREIQEDYGPNGLLGYDLVNGYADVTSYTQLAAFTCNGLLLGLTRGQVQGKMAPFYKYIALSHKEWSLSQRSWNRPENTHCWLLQHSEFLRRHCMDTRMLDTLDRDDFGTLEEPRNAFNQPGSLTSAVAVGMFFHRHRIRLTEINRLGAESVALTHGSPTAFLTGAMLAHIITCILRKPDAPLKAVFVHAMKDIREEFGHQYSQAYEICNQMRNAMTYASGKGLKPVEVMEKLKCVSSSEVLAGAVYACLACDGDFDRAMILAVNHSGRSAAVGAVTGAILGAKYGEKALPEFYMECLEPSELLRELADDLYHGCTMEKGNKLYDLDWDRKYLHGGR